MLDVHELGVESESENACPLQNLICDSLFGTNTFEYSEPEVSLKSMSQSQSSINYVLEEQSKQDHEYRMLQLQLQNEYEGWKNIS